MLFLIIPKYSNYFFTNQLKSSWILKKFFVTLEWMTGLLEKAEE